MTAVQTNENVAYHAARLLLLIALCGRPQRNQSGRLPGVKGRTLLAKLDFFLRYPSYLLAAGEVLRRPVQPAEIGLERPAADTVESRMVRYLYGPWDHVYYVTLAYLIGKGLISVEMSSGTETFRVTAQGLEVAERLRSDADFSDLAKRATAAYGLFNAFSGTGLKEFIYRHFPEVVGRKLGATI